MTQQLPNATHKLLFRFKYSDHTWTEWLSSEPQWHAGPSELAHGFLARLQPFLVFSQLREIATDAEVPIQQLESLYL